MPERSDYITRSLYDQETLRKMYKPSNHIFKMLEPSNRIQKMIEEQSSYQKMFEPPDYVYKMLEEQESLRRMFEPSDQIQQMIEQQNSYRKMFSPSDYMYKILEEQDSLRRMLEPPDYLQKIFEEQDSFREMFAPKGVAFTAFQSMLNEGFNFTERIQSLVGDVSIPDFSVNSDGSLSFEDYKINAADITAEVHSFFEDIAENSSTEIVISRLMNLKKPAQRIAIWILKNIIVTFVISIVASFSTSNLQNYFNSKSLKSNREVTCAIKNIPPEIDIYDYKGYRVVTADVLNLRQKPNMNSQIIDKLKRGKLVRIVQKKKNWTKVDVECSKDDELLSGWVTTRYIVPLTR